MDAHTHISWPRGWGDDGTYADLKPPARHSRLMAIKLAREALIPAFTTSGRGGNRGEYAMTDFVSRWRWGWFHRADDSELRKDALGPYGGQYHRFRP